MLSYWKNEVLRKLPLLFNLTSCDFPKPATSLLKKKEIPKNAFPQKVLNSSLLFWVCPWIHSSDVCFRTRALSKTRSCFASSFNLNPKAKFWR